MQQALDWVYSGDIISGEEAVAAGLCKSLHTGEELMPAACALARKYVVNRSPVGIALARQMMYRNSALPHPRDG